MDFLSNKLLQLDTNVTNNSVGTTLSTSNERDEEMHVVLTEMQVLKRFIAVSKENKFNQNGGGKLC